MLQHLGVTIFMNFIKHLSSVSRESFSSLFNRFLPAAGSKSKMFLQSLCSLWGSQTPVTYFLPEMLEKSSSWIYLLHRPCHGHALPGNHQVQEIFKCKVCYFKLWMLNPTLDFNSAVREASMPRTPGQPPSVAPVSSLLTSPSGTAKASLHSQCAQLLKNTRSSA